MNTTAIDTPRRYAASALGRRRFLAGGAGTAAGQLAEPSTSQPEEYSFEQVSIRDPSGAPRIPAGPDPVTASPDNAAMTDLDVWMNLSAVKAGRVDPIVPGASSTGTAIQLADRMHTVMTELAGS